MTPHHAPEVESLVRGVLYCLLGASHPFNLDHMDEKGLVSREVKVEFSADEGKVVTDRVDVEVALAND